MKFLMSKFLQVTYYKVFFNYNICFWSTNAIFK